MSIELATEADLAEILRISEKRVQELRRQHSWPCVRLSHKVIRFTPDQIEAIVAQHSATTPAAKPAPAAVPAIPGQTARSRSRRSS